MTWTQALEYLKQGGWMMIPLLACSVLMWMLILERWRTYHSLSRDDMRSGLLAEFLPARCGVPEIDRRILQQFTLPLRNGLQDRLALITALAAVAPLLGLLGTVTGMIETFQVISVFGTGNARALAGGVSVALVTTQSGLLVAIPGLLISGALRRRAQKLETRLDEIATLLDRRIRRSLPLDITGPEVAGR